MTMATESLTTENKLQLPMQIASIILDAFNKHYRIFSQITGAARQRFIDADWDAERQASAERITLYTQRVTEACEELKKQFDLSEVDKPLWNAVKQCYISKLYEHKQPELAETFYNSVFTWSFDRRYYDNSNIFVRPSQSTEYLLGKKPTYYCYYPAIDNIETSVSSILEKVDPGLPYDNCLRDIDHLVEQFKNTIYPDKSHYASYQLQVISSLFYRNKAAYIVGRVFNGLQYAPFAIALLNTGKGKVYVDALVTSRKDITNLFSFSRAYFMVKTQVPSAIVQFLLQILPSKKAAEIYAAIGLQKQGKSEFYRGFLHHLVHSNDQFQVSKGVKGMVMSVFTLPSYPFVFKVINDRFAPPKIATRKMVKEKYRIVKMHDRVGRMADTLEFSYVSLPLSRFSDALLNELKETIADSLQFEGEMLVIRHLYIERRLTPLNIFLDETPVDQLEGAIYGYGNCIKELAAANIFPGDLLTKNFGVTRHGRVIFYDYDEIEFLLDCNFRDIPEPRTPEDEMAAEPWYSVEPLDVFPEEFLSFLFSKEEHRKIFLSHHADLLQASYWRSLQDKIRNKEYANVYPYSQNIRFGSLYAEFN